MMKENALINISMSESRAPELGINSWLEDELYQQYLNDRKNVDESWKEVFETNGGSASEAPAADPRRPASAPANGSHAPQQQAVALHNGGSRRHSTLTVPEHQPVAGETLMPLRGAAARIAENMNASLTIPLATSQRIIPVKVIDENRRIINEHRALLGKSKISYTHLIGWAIVKALRSNPTLNHAYAETQRPAVPRGARPGQHRHRGGCGGQRRRAVAESAEHQGRRRRWTSRSSSAPSTTSLRARATTS